MRFAVAAASLLALAAPAFGQSAPAPRTTQGACARLVLANQDATASCVGRLSTMALPDGTQFFIFNAGRTMIGFSGRRADLVANAPWPVRFVNVGVPGREPNAIPASGSCRIADPARGAGSTVCAARTEQGRFEAEFQGVAPRREPAR